MYYIVSLHQTTTKQDVGTESNSCIISFLYIKPQLNPASVNRRMVVLYRFSTSNHNHVARNNALPDVVLYRFSTSNHNLSRFFCVKIPLYYIVSLHQTTTLVVLSVSRLVLYYIVSLHQTTTNRFVERYCGGLYYIVSLHQTTTGGNVYNATAKLYYIVSLHQTTTNQARVGIRRVLYYIVSLHQTTTLLLLLLPILGCIISFLYIKPQLMCIYSAVPASCIISFLYIKPQLLRTYKYEVDVVLYRFSTSNHNKGVKTIISDQLYYIVSLHQTTTLNVVPWFAWQLYYIVSLHQTTTRRWWLRNRLGCIISFLYIKPQLTAL